MTNRTVSTSFLYFTLINLTVHIVKYDQLQPFAFKLRNIGQYRYQVFNVIDIPVWSRNIDTIEKYRSFRYFSVLQMGPLVEVILHGDCILLGPYTVLCARKVFVCLAFVELFGLFMYFLLIQLSEIGFVF